MGLEDLQGDLVRDLEVEARGFQGEDDYHGADFYPEIEAWDWQEYNGSSLGL